MELKTEIDKRYDKAFLLMNELTELKNKSRFQFLNGIKIKDKDRKRYNSLLLLYKFELNKLQELKELNYKIYNKGAI